MHEIARGEAMSEHQAPVAGNVDALRRAIQEAYEAVGRGGSLLPDQSPELTFQEAPLFLSHLVSLELLYPRIYPLLEKTELEEAEGVEDWYVAYQYDAPGGSFSLQVFVWPPGAWTRVHDHSSWGVFCCVVGSLVEERFGRLDDGSLTEYARLRKVWRRTWRKKDEISTVLPYSGGIHRVGNPTTSTAISVHLYGPQIGEVDGRDYDPSRNYVCDRRARAENLALAGRPAHPRTGPLMIHTRPLSYPPLSFLR
jgi:hypothetical protein